MKTINEIIKEIDALNIPEGDAFTPNTKMWALFRLSAALSIEKEANDGDELAKKELGVIVTEWEDFINEFSPKAKSITNPITKREMWNEEEIFDKETLYTMDGISGLTLKVGFYNAHDFMGKPKKVIGLYLTKDGEAYCTLTTNFGEFIGQIATTYIDTNNHINAESFLIENHIGHKTPMTKHSGFYEYPLFIINPKFLKEFMDKEELYSYIRDYDFMFDFEIPSDEECENFLNDMISTFYALVNKEMEEK